MTSKQAFETKRPECIEEDVRKTWFSNKPLTEQMAWMVISRKKRSYPDFSKSAQEISFSEMKVIGGSMTSPVTFVCHWELAKLIDELKVSFQFETKRIIIAKECKLETGNVPVLLLNHHSIHFTKISLFIKQIELLLSY